MNVRPAGAPLTPAKAAASCTAAWQITGTRYEQLSTAPRLGELIDRFAADTAPHDLTHELHLLRALVADYIERYEATTEALLAWHASFNGDFELKLRKWRTDIAAYIEEMEASGTEPKRPMPRPPYPSTEKPRQMVDITNVAGLIDKIGGMSDRIQKRQETGAISMARLSAVLEELAVELVNACEEVGIRDNDRTRLLESVDRRWRDTRSIPRDALSVHEGVPEGARSVN